MPLTTKEWLKKGLKEIPEEYFKFFSKNNDFQERVLTYEYYHQLRKLISNGEVQANPNKTFSAEVDKTPNEGVPWNNQPDFIFHQLGQVNNEIIIEVKTKCTAKNIVIDMKKISDFIKDEMTKYDNGYFILIGFTLEELEKKMKKAYKNKMRLKELKESMSLEEQSKIIILTLKNYGLEVEEKNFKDFNFY